MAKTVHAKYTLNAQNTRHHKEKQAHLYLMNDQSTKSTNDKV